MVKIDPCWENCKYLYLFLIALAWFALVLWAFIGSVQYAIECGWCTHWCENIVFIGFILFLSAIGFLDALDCFIMWLQGDCGD